MSTTGHFYDRTLIAPAKVIREEFWVDGGRCDDHFQVRPVWEAALDERYEDVCVYASLVSLVNDHTGVLGEIRVGNALVEK